MAIFLVTAPTAGREIKVMELLNVWNNLEETIQELADDGWDFIGQISEHYPTGSWGHASKTFLFLRDRQLEDVSERGSR